MSLIIPGIFVGLAVGSIYGLTAMGLVLSFRTSGVFNLAHGAIGMFGTYVFWQLWQQWHWPLAVALGATLLIAAPALGAVSYFAVFRWVQDRPLAVSLVAGIIWLGVLSGASSLIWGTVYQDLPPIFGSRLFAVTGSFNASAQQLGTIAVAFVIGAVLLWYLQRTNLGRMTRAVVDNRELSRISGQPANLIQLSSWIISAVLAVLSGILISPFIQLSQTGLTLIVIQAVSAAVLGRLRSLPLTYVGGLTVGLLATFLALYLPQGQTAQGLKVSTAFIVVYLAVLAGQRFGFFDALSSELRSGMLGREIPASRVSPLLVLFAFLALGFGLLPEHLQFLVTAGLVLSVALQGFVLVTGLGGQIVLCQAALTGIGAVMFGRMVQDWRLPILLAGLLAVAVTVILGLAVSLPAVRVRGLPLALVSLAFGLFMDNFLFPAQAFSGGYTGYQVSRPEIFSLELTSQAYGYLVMSLALLVALAVRNLASGRTGRLLTAARTSEIATESFGRSIRQSKLLLFSLASVFAGVSGVLTAINIGSVTALDFNVEQSLAWLTVAVLCGVGNAQGAVLGGIVFFLLPYYLTQYGLGNGTQLIFGLLALAVFSARRGGLADVIFLPLLALARPAGQRPTASTPPGASARKSGTIALHARVVPDPAPVSSSPRSQTSPHQVHRSTPRTGTASPGTPPPAPAPTQLKAKSTTRRVPSQEAAQ